MPQEALNAPVFKYGENDALTDSRGLKILASRLQVDGVDEILVTCDKAQSQT